MSKLIVKNEQQYFDLAFEIATNKEKYNKLKLELKNNLKITALFNTKKYVKNLEMGYEIAFKNKANKNIVEHIEV